MELKFIFFFAMLVSLYDFISCDVINVKNFREILRYFLKFWLRLWGIRLKVTNLEKDQVILIQVSL